MQPAAGVRGFFSRPLLRRAVVLFALGALQGVLGWLLVKSGLADRPSVSHYRLAAHLSLAFLIFGWAVWLAQDLRTHRKVALEKPQQLLMRRALGAIGAVLAAQIVWGAFVAGLKAGKYYPTFPLMGGRIVPPDMLRLDPIVQNFIANPSAVQWLHRVIGTALTILVVATFVIVRSNVEERTSRGHSAALTGLIGVQYLLGIATLLLHVPVSLGVMHQALAMVLFGVWLCWLHHVVMATPSPAPARR